MSKWDRENTIFITANQSYLFDGLKSEGCKVYHPYKGNSFFLRIIREIFFRVPFLSKALWFNKKILVSKKVKYIVIYDALITLRFLEWINHCFPEAQINFKYSNLVGKAKHLMPDSIPKNIRIWTYDLNDAIKYGILYNNSYCYFSSFVKQSGDIEYDVFYVGRDKGRGDYLIKLRDQLNEMGLNTKFIITKNGKFSHKKSYYNKEITYEEVTKYISRSKSVLNIVLEGQEGVTMRDLESLFFKKKLITNNESLKTKEFFNDKNIFILKENNLLELVDFLKEPYNDLPNELLQKYTFDNAIDLITNDSMK